MCSNLQTIYFEAKKKRDENSDQKLQVSVKRTSTSTS
jgi:hypothetical protein